MEAKKRKIEEAQSFLLPSQKAKIQREKNQRYYGTEYDIGQNSTFIQNNFMSEENYA